jgi:hypothetical protein
LDVFFNDGGRRQFKKSVRQSNRHRLLSGEEFIRLWIEPWADFIGALAGPPLNGLAWDDCEELLGKLGFAPRVEVVAV